MATRDGSTALFNCNEPQIDDLINLKKSINNRFAVGLQRRYDLEMVRSRAFSCCCFFFLFFKLLAIRQVKVHDVCDPKKN